MHHLDTILSVRRSPSLAKLDLTGGTKPSLSRRRTESGPVELPHLRELKLNDDTSWVSDVLEKFIFPTSTVLRIRTNYDRTTNIPPSLRARPTIHTVDRVRLQAYHERGITPTCEVQACRGESIRIHLHVVGVQMSTIACEVSQAFGSDSVKDLRVWIPSPDIYRELEMGTHIVQLLSSFPQITRLNVRRNCPDDLFRVLGMRTVEGAPICASLEHLVVYWRLGAVSHRSDEGAFHACCELIKVTLERRAELGSRLRKFVFRCEYMRRLGPHVDAGMIERDLAVQLQGVASEVVVRAEPGETWKAK